MMVELYEYIYDFLFEGVLLKTKNKKTGGNGSFVVCCTRQTMFLPCAADRAHGKVAILGHMLALCRAPQRGHTAKLPSWAIAGALCRVPSLAHGKASIFAVRKECGTRQSLNFARLSSKLCRVPRA